MPMAYMRDVVNGQSVSAIMHAYAMRDDDTRLVELTVDEWNALPYFYFDEDGPAPRMPARPFDSVPPTARPPLRGSEESAVTGHARPRLHSYPPEKFPLTLQLYSGKTGELLWSRTVTIDEARARAEIEIPGYAGTEHYSVRAEILYADGTASVAGMS